jgi:hypothetical protein
MALAFFSFKVTLRELPSQVFTKLMQFQRKEKKSKNQVFSNVCSETHRKKAETEKSNCSQEVWCFQKKSFLEST